MKPSLILTASAAVLCTILACKQNNHDADIQALKDYEAKWSQDFATHDPAVLVAHYTDDAVLMSPGQPATTGKTAILAMMQQMLTDPTLSLKFAPTHIEVAQSGDMAFTRGTYTMTMTDPQTHQLINDHGSYVTTYRKQPDNSWKAVEDIASSELPPEPPK